MPKLEPLAGFASSIGLFAFLSMSYRIFKTNNTSSLGTVSLVANLNAQLLLFIYSYINNLKGLMYPIIVYIIGLIYILYVKIIQNREYE